MIRKMMMLSAFVAATILNICGANLSEMSAKMSQVRVADRTFRFAYPGVATFGKQGVYPLLPRQLHMDVARETMEVDRILPFENNNTDIISYTGKGVVIGVVDTGFEPTHIAFSERGDSLQSRVRRYVLLSGAAESDTGDLEVYEYTTSEEIAKAHVETWAEGHGTHVAGTAAGAWMGNNLYGVAPDAELVMVSLGELLYDDEILYGINYSMDYAREVGKPVVVNLSLGSQYGPHDGSGYVTDYMRELDPEGRIVIFSAGNDGSSMASLDVDLAVTESMSSFLSERWKWCPTTHPAVQIWSYDDRSFEIRLVVRDRNNKTTLYRTEEISAETLGEQLKDGVWLVNSKDKDTELFGELSNYYKGQLMISGGLSEANNRYGIELAGEFEDMDDDYPYFLGFEVTSRQQAHVMAVTEITRCYFTRYDLSDYITGSDMHCISDHCTSPYVIAVGSWNHRFGYTDVKGNEHEINYQSIGNKDEMATYSSHGSVIPTGESLPHVVAPGTMVLAPYNSKWVREMKGSAKIAAQQRVNGKLQYWGENTGTSMASPNVSGVVALWLEAKPDLTRDQVLEVMANSCKKDEFTDADPARAGYGKIDAYEGIKYIHSRWETGVTGLEDINDIKPCFRRISPTEIECVLPHSVSTGNIDVFGIDGALKHSLKITDNILTIPASKGLNIIKVSTPNGAVSLKIAI